MSTSRAGLAAAGCFLLMAAWPAASEAVVVVRATGALTQLTSPSDCLEQGGTDCGTHTGIIGLKGAEAVATSPDGKSLYVAAYYGSDVAEFARNTTTGALSQLGGNDSCIANTDTECPTTATGFGDPGAVAVSPDGKNVYVVSDGVGAIAEFSRDGTTGALTQLAGANACLGGVGTGCSSATGLTNAYDLVVSPDGKNVYVAAGGNGSDFGDVAEFSRDATTGALTQLAGADDCFEEHGGTGTACGTRTGHGLRAANRLVISPDGTSVYAAEDNSPGAIAELSRNTTTGALTQPNGCIGADNTECSTAGHGLDDVYGMVMSPDGKNVYTSSLATHGPIAELARDTSTGALSQLASPDDCIQEAAGTGCGTKTGHPLKSAYALAISPDGANLYAAADQDEALLELSRNSTTGALTQLAAPDDCIQQTGGTACGTTGTGLAPAPLGVAVSSDGASVYVATSNNSTGGAVAEFSRIAPVDTTPPDTSIDSGPADGSTTTSTTPQFGFTSTEVGSTFECAVDSGAYATCTSPYTTPALANGLHTFSVRATDAAGNTDGSPATRTFTVDTSGGASTPGAAAAPSSGGGGVSSAPPVVSAVSPAGGPAGTSVGIAGDHFDQVTQVLFGSTPASFFIDGYNHITAIAPNGVSGAVGITVVGARGTSTASPADLFTYSATIAASGPPRPGPVTLPAVASDAAVLALLHRALTGASFNAAGNAVTFGDTLGEAGQALYGLDLSFYRGAQTARVHRPLRLGRARVTVTKGQPVTVRIPLTHRARRLLRRHPGARLVIRTYFVAAANGHHINTSRTIRPHHRPG